MTASVETETESEVLERTCETLVERIPVGDIDRDDLEPTKPDACSEYFLPEVPKNTEILQYASENRREEVKEAVQRKPVHAASGVSPVAIMTSSHMRPYGKCLCCPGGPTGEFPPSQSYTGHEPAATRGVQSDYDPYGQVTLRLEQPQHIGHPVDEVEFILMDGTMIARSHDYQEWFVKRALETANDYDLDEEPEPAENRPFKSDPEGVEFKYIESITVKNETNGIRNIGTTSETEPDWCDPEQTGRMFDLGATKVEVGVQTTYRRINREMYRGHGMQAPIDASRRLRNSVFKADFHTMSGQFGVTKEMCLEDFRQLPENSDRWSDHLKVYPTLVVRDTVTYGIWRCDEYEPLNNEEATDTVVEVMGMIPKYTRLQRAQRDIPVGLVDAGVWKSSLRQLAAQRAEERGIARRDTHAREVGVDEADPDPERVELDVTTYEVAGGAEHFISFKDPAEDLLAGFCRL